MKEDKIRHVIPCKDVAFKDALVYSPVYNHVCKLFLQRTDRFKDFVALTLQSENQAKTKHIIQYYSITLICPNS